MERSLTLAAEKQVDITEELIIGAEKIGVIFTDGSP